MFGKQCLSVLAMSLVVVTAAWADPPYVAVELGCSGYGSVLDINSGQRVGVGAGSHAYLWTSNTTYIDLHPSAFSSSQASATNGTQQAGYGSGGIAGTYSHALLWNGSATNYVDLNPAGYRESQIAGIFGSQEVGYAVTTGGQGPHAMLWNGSATSYVDLHSSSSFYHTSASGTNGTNQVGWGSGPATPMNIFGYNDYHALMWHGSASGYVDLNPVGINQSCALDICGNQQVGYGWANRPDRSVDCRALLWTGTAASCIDLTPAGYTAVKAFATNGVRQVGQARAGNWFHAMVWQGSAQDYVDLQQFLPSGYVGSFATGIDNNGVIVGYAWDSQIENHPVMWIPVPEPATLSLLALGGLAVIRRRKCDVHNRWRPSPAGNRP